MKFSKTKFAMKSLFALATIFVASTAFATKPLEGKHLILAMSIGFPPFESYEINEKGESELMGMDIDLADALAEKLGFTYEVMGTNFAGLIGALVGGRADFVISGISGNEERRKSVDITVPYYYASTSIVQPIGGNIRHVADMKGKKITASFGTEDANFAEAAGADVVAMELSSMCLQELLSGRAEGLVQESAAAAVLCKKYPDVLEFHVIPAEEVASLNDRLAGFSFSVFLPKGSELFPLFDEQVANFTKDGTMEAIYEKWIGPWPYGD